MFPNGEGNDIYGEPPEASFKKNTYTPQRGGGGEGREGGRRGETRYLIID